MNQHSYTHDHNSKMCVPYFRNNEADSPVHSAEDSTYLEESCTINDLMAAGILHWSVAIGHLRKNTALTQAAGGYVG